MDDGWVQRIRLDVEPYVELHRRLGRKVVEEQKIAVERFLAIYIDRHFLAPGPIERKQDMLNMSYARAGCQESGRVCNARYRQKLVIDAILESSAKSVFLFKGI